MSKRTKSIIAVCAAALLLLMILLPTLNRGKSNEAEEFEIVSAKVSKGEIVSTVSGSGSLSAGNGLKVSIPQGVRVTKYLVADGDTVSEGQALFEVERASVMQTISLVSNSLDYLKTEIQAAIGAGESKNILAPLYGRVKAVYASVGESADEVMKRDGCLLVLSIDGMMSVEIETEVHSRPGDSVKVELSGGEVYDGKAESHKAGKTAVTLTDDGPRLGDRAKVYTPQGELLGEGTLRVHSAWNLAVSSGTVSFMTEQLEREVPRGTILCTVKETTVGSRRFDEAVYEHQRYEEVLNELFEIYRSGKVLSPAEGTISGIDVSRLGAESTSLSDYKLQTVEYPASRSGDDTPSNAEMMYMSGMDEEGNALSNEQLVALQQEILEEQKKDTVYKVSKDFKIYDLTGNEIMNVIPKRSITMQMQVDEADILSVAPGQEAEISVDAISGRVFEGKVVSIDPVGKYQSGSTRYTVSLDCGWDEDMYHGMNATAILEVGKKDGILTLPVAALYEEGGRTVVYTDYDAKSKTIGSPVEVETGVSDGYTAEIISGLSEGAEVFYRQYG